ncbi:MAG: NAD(P)-dependent oxidoreductase [Ruminiclostridium sp.]
MKLVIIEPLGVAEEKLLKMATDILGTVIEVIYYDTRVSDTETLISRGEDADIILVSNLSLNEEVINGCKNLKMLSVAFTGIDHIAVDACKRKNITVCNCAGYSTAAVADLVFALLLCIYRNIIPCDRVIRDKGTKDGLVGFELEGKKFGVVGTGAIGSRVAVIAHAFGCEVYAYSRTRKNIDGITYMDLDTLMSTCDVVSLHVPLSPETKGLINEEKLKLMKKNAVLINTARGPIVDSTALANVLKNKGIFAAGIDVFETEPPIETTHPILSAPNVIATPHVAFATKEALEKREVIVLQNVKQWLNKTPQNIIL